MPSHAASRLGRMFTADALRAVRVVMSGERADEAGAAYLAVFALLAAEALWPAAGRY